jgi:hypothetical protein
VRDGSGEGGIVADAAVASAGGVSSARFSIPRGRGGVGCTRLNDWNPGGFGDGVVACRKGREETIRRTDGRLELVGQAAD